MESLPQKDKQNSFKKLPWQLKFLFKISKILGLFPLTEKLNISSRWYTFSLLAITFFLTSNIVSKIYIFQWTNFDFVDETELISYATFSMRLIVDNGVILIHLISLIFRHELLRTILNEIRNLLSIPHQGSHFSLLLPMLILFSIFGMFLLNYILEPSFTLIDSIISSCNASSNLITTIIVLQFCLILEYSWNHLVNITKELKSSQYELLKLIKIHFFLITLCQNTMIFYSWQILALCLKIFLNIIIYFYKNINSVITIWQRGNFILMDELWISYPILGLSLEIGSLLCFSLNCEKTKKEAENFVNELFKIMKESQDLCSNNKLHLYVTMKPTVSFTACGFFNLGYPLVTSIIAAAVTYLVILVQFSMPAEHNPHSNNN